MASIWDWSTTAGSNASSDANINWSEGQSPATVNDSARQMMGRIAEFRDDINGSVELAGVNTLTATMNSGFTTYATGLMVTAQVPSANTSTTVTLNLNSIAAKNIVKITSEGEENLAVGDLKAGSFVTFIYDADADGASGAWVLPVPTTANDAEMQRFNRQGAAIASDTTTDISAPTGDYISITGTTTITDLGTAAVGVRRTLVFADALTLTHNATSLILPTGANITTLAGDMADFLSLGSGNWLCTRYYDTNDKDYLYRIRLADGGDVSVGSTTHGFQIGIDSSTNIAMDSNEIQARNNGAAATLAIQQGGGTANFGGSVQFADDLNSADGSGFFYDYSVGRLGLGTASPDYMLHLKSAAPIIKFEDTTAGSGYNLIYQADTDMIFSCDHTAVGTGSGMIFRVDGSTVFQATSSGVFFSKTQTTFPGDSVLSNGVGEEVEFNNSNNQLRFTVTGDEKYRINSSGDLIAQDAGGILDGFTGIYGNTTGLAANVRINSSGQFFGQASTAAIKDQIEDISIMEAMMALGAVKPRSYVSKMPKDPKHKLYGFIAEEVADIGLEGLVDRKPDGSPYSVEYFSFVPILTKIVQHQRDQITVLEAKVDLLLAKPQ